MLDKEVMIVIIMEMIIITNKTQAQILPARNQVKKVVKKVKEVLKMKMEIIIKAKTKTI